MLFVEADQVTAEFGLEHVRNDEDGSREFESCIMAHRWQLTKVGHHPLAVAAILLEREDRPHAQGWIEHHPEAPDWDRALPRLNVPRQGPVKPSDRAIEIPEVADAGNDLLGAALGLIRRIDAHAEERDLLVVEE